MFGFARWATLRPRADDDEVPVGLLLGHVGDVGVDPILDEAEEADDRALRFLISAGSAGASWGSGAFGNGRGGAVEARRVSGFHWFFAGGASGGREDDVGLRERAYLGDDFVAVDIAEVDDHSSVQ